MKIKETLKGFNLNIDDIEPCDFEESIKDLCKNIALALDKQRYEIVLNKNIIDIKDTFTNFHSYMGLKVSFESFEKDIGFIVRPNFELSYDELQQENKQLKAQIEEYQKALDETMSEKIDIQNNWNELKECLKDVMNGSEADDKEFVETILDIIQEIEQRSDSNE